jgi:hypothetical protein
MARSLLRQLEQIRRAATYDDTVASVNLADVAEPTVSGSLEEDTNVIRTIMKQLKGTTNWFDAPPKYFDPTDTTAGNVENKDATLANIANNTLDANTIIVAVSDDNSGLGYTVSGTSDGVLLSPITTNYADPVNRMGLPIFASTANNGTYYDEDGDDNVCRIDVINTSDDSEFVTNDGHIVYAKFHDGADYSGTGENADAYAKLYANDAVIDMSTVSGTVENIMFVYPVRKRLSDMQEHEWLRTDFISSWEGDVELIEDIQNLWSYTGASNNIDTTTGSWNNTSASYLLQSDPSNLKSAVDAINDGVGSRLFSEENYISDGANITTALDALDQSMADISDQIDAGVGEKFVESVATLITKNTPHTIPAAIVIYTPENTAGREGKNMDIYVDGQLLAADTGAAGANADRDYGETSGTQVTFRFDIQAGRNITYIVRQ